ncbi:MAG TPA: tRNA (adenosine(37)-N6)-threonylcarbamoyltransferase complex transferase subunit TsaD [Myxococcota bacterium]|nr:tRNA (adenosine(37)-N6)-threonylcarbamoyltransferase complex transferase subunit TsaD [Myxococcota bacterium]HNZ03250.1 tRNA (adenosine(37)-N6)-threonylcarbamoyltransferase complex transferase subunit TsaD [Myxococcota bacterium]HPB50409.1 tRNA (adenosine(37)-N6)-threonylcarbamoyltransferase complex transferase subunit TsaD [Myxococcota bacterium]HQP95337.1 tRNA (adenosine(37)-N6)-threonylcarbamoyltransferase complex transferase subunit TsaD [Myxococcota bacterium]
MKVLGIESSCDETSAAVVEDGRRVLSNVVWSQIKVHEPYGGVVPELASRNHLRYITPVVDSALEQAGIQASELDGIAVTIGPGLMGSLLVGVQFAKAMALATGKPLVGVNHLEGHLSASFMIDGITPPSFPFIGLAVSGGHTSIYRVNGWGDLTLLGRTLDDAAGEAFDKAAAMLGLSYPGGVVIDRISRGRAVDVVTLPRPMLRDESLNMSFSGLKTALKRHIEGLDHTPGPDETADIASSFQEAVVDILVHKVMRAARVPGIGEVVIAGGVAANSRLRARMESACKGAGKRLVAVPLSLCTDNAAMIAGLGYQYLFGVLRDAPCPRGLDMDPFMRHVGVG